MAHLVVAVALVVACTGKDTQDSDTGPLPTVSAKVSAADGASVLLPDGSGVILEPGALSEDATVTVTQVAPPGAWPDAVSAPGAAYEFTLDPPTATVASATWHLLLPSGEGWATILHFVEQTGEWADIGGEATGDGYVDQQVSHFSIGGPAMLRATAPLPPASPPADPPPPVPTPAMVNIPGGTFYMGAAEGFDSEQPVHAVHVDAFEIGKYEVTNAEFTSFLVSQGNQTQDGGPWYDPADASCHIHGSGHVFTVDAGYENHPVVCVSPAGAIAYASWLSAAKGYDTAYGAGGVVDLGSDGYRLPTEAEWEYAATLGRGQVWRFAWGNDPLSTGSPQADTGQVESGTRPVGAYPSSGWWGVYDLGGNVSEYCSDWFEYHDYPDAPVSNPVGPTTSSLGARAMRGPNWYTSSEYDGYYLRVAVRNGTISGGSAPTFGFRLARSR